MTIRESRPEGAIVYWNGAPTDRGRLQEGLAAIGMEDYTPCQRTEAAALKMALEEYVDGVLVDRRARKADGGEKVRRDKLVEPLLSQKEDGFEVVDVTRKQRGNDYVCDFRAKIDSGRVVISYGYASADRVQELYEVHRGTLGASAVGGALIEIAKELGGVTLRDSGGVYWLPTDKLAQWERVINAFETAGGNQVYMVRTVMDAKTVRAVNDAIVEEVLKASGALADEIRSGQLGEQALETRKQRAKALHSRVTEYEGILGQAMRHLHDVIGIAEMAAASATAMKETETVFDGLFAEV